MLTLYLDITTSTLFSSLSGGTVVTPTAIPLFFGDTVAMEIYLIEPVSTAVPGQNKYKILPTNGLSLVLYLDCGLENSSIYTQQVNWQTDPNNQYFFANLALNTQKLSALLAGKVQTNCYLKIGIVNNNLPTTVYAGQVTIKAGLPTNNLVVPAGQTPLSQEVAAQEFYPIAGRAGLGYMLISPLGKKIFVSAIDNPDGTASVQEAPVN